MTRKLHFVASDASEAKDALVALRARHEDVGPERADIVVALGGDGFMLQTLHNVLTNAKPIYGMNCGSVGFLMNDYSESGLEERLDAAEAAKVHPLCMRAHTKDGI